MPLAVWYDLRDDSPDGADPEKNYGLLDDKGKDKPAMSALLTLMKTAKDRTFVGWVRDTPPGMHAMRLDGTSDTVIIVWNESARRAADRSRIESAPSFCNLADGRCIQNKREAGKGFGAMGILKDSAGPVYLAMGKELRRQPLEGLF